MNTARPHIVERILKEAVFYPAHSPRTESSEYVKVHHHLTYELDLPCLACGVRNSTLQDPVKNIHRSKEIETHHHIVEWALMNAVDVNKFNERIVAFHRAKDPTNPKYTHDFTEKEMKAWIDHDPDNLWPLCDVCHRHALYGIHMITFPIWGAMDLIKENFEYIPLEKKGDGGAYILQEGSHG